MDIYRTKYVTATNNQIATSCFGGISDFSVPHASVLQVVKDIRALKPFSEPLFQQQVCTYAEMSRDVQAMTTANAQELYSAVIGLQSSAAASTVYLSAEGVACTAEAISNLALVNEAQCETGATTRRRDGRTFPVGRLKTPSLVRLGLRQTWRSTEC